MFKGSQERTKIDIIIYLLIMLLIEGSVDSNVIKRKFNISTKTFYRYMNYIKMLLFDYGIYYIELEYDRINKIHNCKVNTVFKSQLKK